MNALRNLVLVGPAGLSLVLFVFAPVVIVLALSFTDYQFGARTAGFVGLDNFEEIVFSTIGRKAVVNTLLYVAIVIPAGVGLGLAVALGLHGLARKTPLLSSALRAIYFLPVAATLVAMAVAWQMLLHPSLGLINRWLSAFGFSGTNWLSNADTVLPVLAVIGIWQSVGYNMVLFLAGLAAIPTQLYQAAEVDGVESGWDRFYLVTWPMLGPTTLFVLIVSAANAFRVFETVATLTRGGPNYASDTIVYALYREGFVYFKAGYASAITVVFFVILLALTLLQMAVLERRVHYR